MFVTFHLVATPNLLIKDSCSINAFDFYPFDFTEYN